MAKVSNNIILHGASGAIGGQIVVRKTRLGTVLAAMPKGPDEDKATAKQKEWREKFRQAVGYAKGAHDRPEYKPLAESRDQSTFNVAVADFLHPPEILDMDLSGYTGKTGETIKVRVLDDVDVTDVGLLMTDKRGVLIEQGKFKRGTVDKTNWEYVATKNAGVEMVRFIVDTADLAGHVAKSEVEKGL